MEILGMSIVLATLVAAITGIAIRNSLGYLQSGSEGFDIRKSVASAITGFLVGVPTIAVAFQTAFENTPEISPIGQLMLFFIQVGFIAGVDATVKSGLKARAKGA